MTTKNRKNKPTEVDHRLTPEERAERLATAFNELNSAVEQITTGEDWRKYLDFQAKFYRYSARNVMWLCAQAEQRGMHLETVASFNTWRKAGRTVDKGQHGLKVLAPVTYRREKTELEIEADRRNEGSMKLSGEVADPTKTTEHHVRGFKVETVFDVSQTSGPPETLPPNPARAPRYIGLCDPEVITTLEYEIVKAGYTVQTVDAAEAGWPESTSGRTTPQNRTVQIRGDMSPAAQAKTLAHELSHIVLEHEQSDPRSETEAESTAYLVMRHLGIDTGSYSFGYVSGWAQDTSTVQRSAETIRRTADQICSQLDERLGRVEPKVEQEVEILQHHPLVEAGNRVRPENGPHIMVLGVTGHSPQEQQLPKPRPVGVGNVLGQGAGGTAREVEM